MADGAPVSNGTHWTHPEKLLGHDCLVINTKSARYCCGSLFLRHWIWQQLKPPLPSLVQVGKRRKIEVSRALSFFVRDFSILYLENNNVLKSVPYWCGCIPTLNFCVRFGGVKSQPFTLGVGLRQGCVLSPLPFVVYMNSMDSHSRVDEGVTAGSCRLICLLFADELACFYPVNRAFNMHLIGFQLRAIKREWKVARTRPRCYVTPRNPRQCILQVSGNALQ